MAEHLPQLLFQQVRPVQPAVGRGDVGQLGGLAHGQVLRILPKGVAGALQLGGVGLLAGAAGVVPHLPADLVQRVGRPLHHVERVHAAHRLGCPLGHDIADPVRRVGADQPDRCGPLLAEVVEEPSHRGLVPPLPGPHQPPGVVVHHHGQVPMALAVGDLIDADAGQPVQRVDPRAASATTPAIITPTVTQATRSSAVIADLDVCVASHAA